MIVWTNGIGGTTGDNLVTCLPLQVIGSVWFVSSVSGIDGVGQGKDRERPLATAAQAVTNAADGDIIVFLANHVQVTTSAVAVAKKLIFVGEGSSGGKPTVKFTSNANAEIFTVTSPNVQFRNIYFAANTLATSSARVSFSAAAVDCMLSGCYFECGPLETGAFGAVVLAQADRFRCVNTTFISTATTLAARPTCGIYCSAGTLADLEMTGCVFSDGTVGFNSSAGYFFATTVTRLRVESMSLLNGADFAVGPSSTGYANTSHASGGGRVVW